MNDLCPQCRVVRDLVMKSQTVQKKNAKGRVTKVQIRSFFCSTCGVFVKSEETSVKHKAR
jgi:hypothetical protein